ncbi:hypothetical protein M0R45_012280 [Rubus argutus]|uniref:Uncharacterized protein n=1 Tax=Rubus argutus TaxID=59490 RepID=A0AAW1YDI3_RUBAR
MIRGGREERDGGPVMLRSNLILSQLICQIRSRYHLSDALCFLLLLQSIYFQRDRSQRSSSTAESNVAGFTAELNVAGVTAKLNVVGFTSELNVRWVQSGITVPRTSSRYDSHPFFASYLLSLFSGRLRIKDRLGPNNFLRPNNFPCALMLG